MSHDLPPLNALRAFEATARLNSVSQAAEQLHVTHGAVSRQLKVLEEHLGVSLFVKEGRGLKLTDAGVRLRDASSDAFERLRTVCAELSQSTADAPFVLGCSGSLLARWFIPRLGRLNADLPDLRLHLSAGEGDLDPRRPGLDALLVFAEPPWPADMQVFELASERIGPVLSPRYSRYEQLREAPASALLNETLLQTTSRPQAWPSWARQNGIDAGALKFGQGFEHLYYLLEAAVAGLGVAIAPQPLVAEDLRAGRLVAPWGFCETPGQLALWLPKRAADGRARQLAQWLSNELRQTP
ncbi:Glycine cleavage system transcriptional activator [Pseudomonas chlororaphis subsp. aurantiaca]|uniref:Glycine cleavage system transcriptional activator n=2 Tax=Pseudomonas chlororaphis TaxID=587753 RepID=A0A3G7TF86_9PSED|nr:MULTISPECIES: LysR family transcriptional regulator [Pseudomonas]AIS15836.1 LysR family transcriptional regulator [Pseudomonas chlororaphis subsp. aurantiaca]AUF99490.1 LysR family transcriptional regulator [Pseudomonas sp. 09C 129]AZC99272.1 Glycine cleavage system transcriptional activator [Pseudomonas chlororaphis subsp. chlororaphis]AZD19378.1 Glycine cleavage system transcriptional activator [Pseudomonas chlororaphis subsp. aurantiaca]AZD32818.1 Glycine cleavage system transcriptional 